MLYAHPNASLCRSVVVHLKKTSPKNNARERLQALLGRAGRRSPLLQHRLHGASPFRDASSRKLLDTRGCGIAPAPHSGLVREEASVFLDQLPVRDGGQQ